MTGRVVNSDGSVTWSGNVTLTPDGEAVRSGPFGASYGGRIQYDGNFSVNNVPPGRYWVLALLSANSEPQFDARVRSPEEAETRAQILRAAEAAKTEVELTPCQNVIDYQLPLKISLLKN